MYFYDTETTVNALDLKPTGEYILDQKKLKEGWGRFHDILLIPVTESIFGKKPVPASEFINCNYYVATLKEVLKSGTSIKSKTKRTLHKRMIEMCSSRYTLTGAGKILTDELTKMNIAIHLHAGERVFLFAKKCSNPRAAESYYISGGLKAEGCRPIANRCNH